MSRFLILLVLACMSIGMIATPTFADSPRERAGRHVVNGDELKKEAEDASELGDEVEAAALFKEAASEYKKAYELVPHPLMLYNLAQVYRLGGKHKLALKNYQAYLAVSPKGEAAQYSRKYIPILEEAIEEADNNEAQEEEAAKVKRKSTAKKKAKKSSSRRKKKEELWDDDELWDEEEEQEEGAGLTSTSYVSFAIMTAGAISVGLGVKFGLDAKAMEACVNHYPKDCANYASRDKLQDANRWPDEIIDVEKNRGPAANRKMFLFTGLGVSAIVGGAVLYFLDTPEDEKEEWAWRIEPDLRQQSWHASLVGTF